MTELDRVAACFRYDGPDPLLTRPLASLDGLPAPVRRGLELARLASQKGRRAESLTFEGFVQVLGARRKTPFAYAAFGAQRAVNYTFSRWVAVGADGRRLGTKLDVGD
jgi:hypothetical protein